MSSARLRTVFFPALLIALGSLGGSYLLEYQVGLEPCPLCYSQRLCMALFAIVCLCALLRAPGSKALRSYSGLALILAVTGAALASRHVWLQGVFAFYDSCPEPLDDTRLPAWLQALIGGPDCVAISWSFLDLTLPEWSLLAFVLLISLTLFGLLSQRLRRRSIA